MKFYFDTEHDTVVSAEQIMHEYIVDHRVGESIYDRIQNSLVCNGGTLVELPGDFVLVDDKEMMNAITEKKSTSKSIDLCAMSMDELLHLQDEVAGAIEIHDQAIKRMHCERIADAIRSVEECIYDGMPDKDASPFYDISIKLQHLLADYHSK